MSLVLTLICLWLASALLALLPMRFQWSTGRVPLVASVPLTGVMVCLHGWIRGAVVAAAMVSMSCNSRRFFARRALGRV